MPVGSQRGILEFAGGILQSAVHIPKYVFYNATVLLVECDEPLDLNNELITRTGSRREKYPSPSFGVLP